MTRHRNKGYFLVLEGIDRCGKSTQAKLLANYLRKKGLSVLHTREPGGTTLGESMRDLILRSPGFVSNRAELLLYEASRAQHVEEKILPALKKGKVVLCERFTMASLAYQGFGRGLPMSQIDKLNEFASFGLEPDLTVVLDISVSEFKRRAGKFLDRMEKKVNFLKAVRDGYGNLSHAKRVIVINAETDEQALHRRIVDKLKNHGIFGN